MGELLNVEVRGWVYGGEAGELVEGGLGDLEVHLVEELGEGGDGQGVGFGAEGGECVSDLLHQLIW